MLGDTAPGTEGRAFSSIARVLCDRSGTFAVYAFLSNSGGSSLPGIWTYREQGGLQLAVRHADIAPGHDGAIAGAFDFLNGQTDTSFKVNASGDVAFYSDLGPSVDPARDGGVWVAHRGGELRLVAQQGDVAPGTNGEVFQSLAPFYVEDDVAINDAGRVAFTARLPDAFQYEPGKRGVWSDRNGSLEAVVIPGAQAPGFPGKIFNTAANVMLNNANQIAFFDEVVANPQEPARAFGYWQSASDSYLRLVFHNGQTVNGTTGKTYSGTFDIVQGELGQVAMIPAFEGPDSSAQGLWMELPGQGLQKILTPLDVTPEGNRVGSFVNCCLTTNDVGGVGLATDYRGIWIADSEGNVRHIADPGQAAPGIENGRFSMMQAPMINNEGLAAFTATVSISHGITSNREPITTTTTGVWAEDDQRHLKMFLKKGDLVDVGEGPGIDLRSVASAQLFGFDDFGRLALGLDFSDGSYGVFLSAPVPEPSTGLQCWLAAITMAFRLARRRRTSPT